MYMNKNNNPITSSNDGVLIDISSDESDSDEASNLLAKGKNKVVLLNHQYFSIITDFRWSPSK